jgi:hypothetical protein
VAAAPTICDHSNERDLPRDHCVGVRLQQGSEEDEECSSSYIHAYGSSGEYDERCTCVCPIILPQRQSSYLHRSRPLGQDPYLVINYSVLAIVTMIAGVAFHTCFRSRDDEEDTENAIGKGDR